MIWVLLIVWLIGAAKHAEFADRHVEPGWWVAVNVLLWPVVDAVYVGFIWWTRWNGHREANR